MAEDGGTHLKGARAQMQKVVRGHGLAVSAVGLVAHGKDAVAAGAAVHQRVGFALAHIVVAEQYIIVVSRVGKAEFAVQFHAQIDADAAGVLFRQGAHLALVVRLALFGDAGKSVHVLHGVVGKAQSAETQRQGAFDLRTRRVAAIGKRRMRMGIGAYAHCFHRLSRPVYHGNSSKSGHFSLIY